MLLTSASKNRTVVRSKAQLQIARAALQAAYTVSEELGASLAERMFTMPRRFERPARERAVLASARPFEVQVVLRSPIRAGATRSLACWRWGFGPTVLLVHGWEGRGSQLASFVEPLVAAGCSVVGFDAVAHGDSPGHRLYLTDLADCIADVAEACGPLHGIVAHSFGAAGVLLAHARSGTAAARNVIVAPNVRIGEAIGRFAAEVGLAAPARAAFERRMAAHSGVALDELALDRLAGARTDDALVIHDRGDREVPFDDGSQLAAVWPQAELHATLDLGHRRVLRDANVIARAVAFLHRGVPAPVSDLVREVDRCLAERS